MPKITSGGASNAREELEPGAQAVEETAVPAAPAAEAAAPAEAEQPAPPAPTEEPSPAPDVASMTKTELQDHADSLGLPTDGTKAVLAARIADHVEGAVAPSETPPQP